MERHSTSELADYFRFEDGYALDVNLEDYH